MINDFTPTATAVGQLLNEKNAAYGDSFAKSGALLKLLFPDGVRLDQYRDLLTIARIVDKLFRIATRKDAFGESPWRDVAGYALLALANDEAEKAASSTQSVIPRRK